MHDKNPKKSSLILFTHHVFILDPLIGGPDSSDKESHNLEKHKRMFFLWVTAGRRELNLVGFPQTCL